MSTWSWATRCSSLGKIAWITSRHQLYIFIKYNSDPRLDKYIGKDKKAMLTVVIFTLTALIALLVFIGCNDPAKQWTQIGQQVSLYILFAMQLLIILATIVFYAVLTSAFVSAAPEEEVTLLRERTETFQIRESLLGSGPHRIDQ
jgi:hypothetical protein